MNPISTWLNKIHQGDALKVLKQMPDEFVDCCITSPPYWNLRDYGVPGQIGLERTIDEYVGKIVEVFREVRRVLKKTGTLWLNMGDSYAGYWGDKYAHKPFGSDRTPNNSTPPNKQSPDFKNSCLKPKDLCLIPARVALAFQDDGWWIRSDIIWSKPNPMPESVTDRPTKAHEYIFLLTKNKKYFYDAEAVKESCLSGPSDIRKMIESLPRIGGKNKEAIDPLLKASSLTNIGQKRSVGSPNGRNLRSVWEIATQPFPGAHFATFPEKLIEPCILAGCPRGGIVLDSFMGSGTVAKVALRLGRQYVGIELNGEYIKMAEKRLRGTNYPIPPEVRDVNLNKEVHNGKGWTYTITEDKGEHYEPSFER